MCDLTTLGTDRHHRCSVQRRRTNSLICFTASGHKLTDSASFGFSGAEERRSGSFPWCSRPAGEQAEEQIHQHPPLWVPSFSLCSVFGSGSALIREWNTERACHQVQFFLSRRLQSGQVDVDAQRWRIRLHQRQLHPSERVLRVFTPCPGGTSVIACFCRFCFISRATNMLKSTSPPRAPCPRLAMISGRWCCSRNLPSWSCWLSATKDGGWVWFNGWVPHQLWGTSWAALRLQVKWSNQMFQWTFVRRRNSKRKNKYEWSCCRK